MTQPVGKRPAAERSDWTEQDLLTREEALPRLREAIEEVEAEYQTTPDGAARQQIAARLQAMKAKIDALSQSGEPQS